MKKFFYPLLLLLAMTSVITSCNNDDDVVIPELTVNIENGQFDDGEFEIATGDTLYFKATAVNTDNCNYTWTVNNKEAQQGIAQLSVFKFVSNTIGDFNVDVKATSIDGSSTELHFKVEVYGKYKKGTFVLNEGNFSSENGKLVFISPKGEVTDSAYFKVNGTHLGHSSQDLYIEDDKMYIISQDNKMNGDGILVVANAETLKKEAAYTKELENLANPTHIVVDDNLAYIRDNNGINLFNLVSKQVYLIKGTEGAGSFNCKNRMAEVDDNVYAMADNQLLMMNNGNLVQSIAMNGKISGIVEGENDILWVSLDKQPAEIVKINGKDGSILAANEITESGLSAGWGATPAISAKGDTIYFSNNTTKIYRHIFNQKKTELMTDVKEHVADAKMAYNNLAVHPETGDVYFTSIKGYGLDYLTNDITVFNFDQQKTPVADYKNFTAFPAGVFFTASF